MGIQKKLPFPEPPGTETGVFDRGVELRHKDSCQSCLRESRNSISPSFIFVPPPRARGFPRVDLFFSVLLAILLFFSFFFLAQLPCSSYEASFCKSAFLQVGPGDGRDSWCFEEAKKKKEGKRENLRGPGLWIPIGSPSSVLSVRIRRFRLFRNMTKHMELALPPNLGSAG